VTSERTHSGLKKKHNIPVMFERIRKAVEPFAPAMLFQIYKEGRTSAFEQLVACLLSIRTRDEVSLHASRRVLGIASRPRELARVPVDKLARLVSPCTFSYQKAQTLIQVSRDILKRFDGECPCDFESLTSLPGVGPKCANLVLGIACGVPRIGVDIHVHRVTNRWGYVSASTPEKTMILLEKKLPREYWVEINELLVPFGKHICLGVKPKCSTCPVLPYCQQVGVTSAR
jgi:endonuclease-3